MGFYFWVICGEDVWVMVGVFVEFGILVVFGYYYGFVGVWYVWFVLIVIDEWIGVVVFWLVIFFKG